jgi:hypothetical protein
MITLVHQVARERCGEGAEGGGALGARETEPRDGASAGTCRRLRVWPARLRGRVQLVEMSAAGPARVDQDREPEGALESAAERRGRRHRAHDMPSRSFRTRNELTRRIAGLTLRSMARRVARADWELGMQSAAPESSPPRSGRPDPVLLLLPRFVAEQDGRVLGGRAEEIWQ